MVQKWSQWESLSYQKYSCLLNLKVGDFRFFWPIWMIFKGRSDHKMITLTTSTYLRPFLEIFDWKPDFWNFITKQIIFTKTNATSIYLRKFWIWTHTQNSSIFRNTFTRSFIKIFCSEKLSNFVSNRFFTWAARFTYFKTLGSILGSSRIMTDYYMNYPDATVYILGQ